MVKKDITQGKSRLFGTYSNAVRIRTNRYGMIRLRILTVGDAAFIEEAMKQPGPARKFVVDLVHHQLMSPELPIEEVESWKDKLLIRVATNWLNHRDTIGKHFRPNDDPFTSVKDALRDYLNEHNQKMMGMFSSIIEPPRFNFVVPEIKLIDSAVTTHLAECAKQNQETISEIIRSFNTIDLVQERFSAISRTWIGELNPMKDVVSSLSVALPNIQSQLAEIAIISRLADSSLSSIDWSSLYDRTPISLELSEVLKSSFLSFSASYANLIESLSEVNLIRFPLEFTRLPAVEYFTGTDLLETITTEDDYFTIDPDKQRVREEIATKTEDSIKRQLLSLNPGLIPLWEGALYALNSDNPERARHFATSLRELFTHVIHQLSPDNEIRKWSSNPSFYDRNKPTRRARLLFICRNINDGPFTDFVEKDVDSVLAFIQLFQRGTHEINIPYTEDQLIALKTKMEGIICFLISIYRQLKENQ